MTPVPSSNCQPLPEALHDAAGTRAIDAAAIRALGDEDGYRLMCRAARSAWRLACDRWPNSRRLLVVAGHGNNGADGVVMAEKALRHGVAVRVFVPDDSSQRPQRSEARKAHGAARAAGIVFESLEAFLNLVPEPDDLIIDALFGTGLSRPPAATHAQVIRAISAAPGPVMSLDIPSGLNPDTGAVTEVCVKADLTVTFIGVNPGLLTGAGPRYCGELVFDDLAVASAAVTSIAPVALRVIPSLAVARVLRRPRDAHKGSHGHVLVVGGNRGMGGAPMLTAMACLRTGAGLVTLATRDAHAGAVLARQPDLMVHGVGSASDLEPLLARADVVAIGPGLGTDAWANELLAAVVASGRPVIADADALNLLSTTADPGVTNERILTPHPGEAGRLLGVSTAEINANRPARVRELADRYTATVVLKGAGSLIAGAQGEPVRLVDHGNPGMAVAGMGDVLTGIVAALRAQGLAALQAASLGVWLHARAGDVVASRRGEAGLIASDVVETVREIRAELVSGVAST